MIVVGVDVHKQSLTAVAVDEAGRVLEERTLACGERSLLAWAGGLGNDRLWALEDCRHVTGALERLLLCRRRRARAGAAEADRNRTPHRQRAR